MATTNDELWMATVNRMYRDEEAKWERDRFKEMPSCDVDVSETDEENGGHDAKSE